MKRLFLSRLELFQENIHDFCIFTGKSLLTLTGFSLFTIRVIQACFYLLKSARDGTTSSNILSSVGSLKNRPNILIWIEKRAYFAILVIGAFFQTTLAQTELVTNGSFASGSTGWVLSGNFYADSRFTSYRSYPGYAYISNADGTAGNNLSGTMYQSVAIPAGASSANMTFWYYITTQETGSTAYDALDVTIQNSAGGYLATVAVFSNLNKGTGYSQVSFNVTSYIGQTIRINFFGTTDASYPTTFRIDDVSILATIPNPPGNFTLTGSAQCSGTASQIQLSWGASTGAATYNVLRNGNDLSTGLTSLQYADNNVIAGTNYSYYIQAKNSSGSTNSNTVSVTASNCAQSSIVYVTPSPTSPTSATVGQNFALSVAVGVVAQSSGVLQVWFYNSDYSVSQQKWAYISGLQSTAKTFSFDSFTQNQTGNSTYTIYTQFRPGATSGPLNDNQINDVTSSSGYQINWQFPGSYPVITSSLTLVQPGTYVAGQYITAKYAITNKGTTPTTLDVLTVGGRIIVNNQETCPSDGCPDFEHKKNITLNPNIPFIYQGNIVLKQEGSYHFFTAYKVGGNWNTAIPTDAGVTNTVNISVNSQPFSLSFPLSGQTPASAVINSVFDHSMSGAGYPKNDTVVAYTGEVGLAAYGEAPDLIYGYKQDTQGTPFYVNGNYSGGSSDNHLAVYLYYDGHPGFDYRASIGINVYADTDGTVQYPSSIPGISNATQYHTLELDHGNLYKTYYLHLSSYPGTPDVVVSAGTKVKTGDLIAHSGDAGVPGSPHLHYEIQYNGIPVDPYGWQGSGIDYYTAGKNIFLWPLSYLHWSYDDPLPVELSEFNAKSDGNEVQILWQTETENASSGFVVQRTQVLSGLANWTNIGSVSGHGTSNLPHKYSYVDRGLVSGSYAYRLKQIDNDGKYKYYSSVQVEIFSPKEFFLDQNFPNPFNPSTTIQYGIPFQSRVKIEVLNVLGQQVKKLIDRDQRRWFL